MKILAIESSCDETAAAVLEKKGNSIRVLSNVIASSSQMHAATGGIIPENAAREQVNFIIPVITQALIDAHLTDTQSKYEDIHNSIQEHIDAFAVTYGPGLIGSLLIGVETARTFSMIFQKPLIPVNHLLAHIYANFIREDITEIQFPAVALIVSGGHTDLLVFKTIHDYQWIGGTRDDAAGEAFDKIGRLLNLPYPAGPEFSKRTQGLHKSEYTFTKPLLHSDDYDFSFSGLKTELQRFIKSNPELSEEHVNQVCFAVQNSITEVLVAKTIKAAETFNAQSILLGGGVSANENLRNKLQLHADSSTPNAKLYFPEMQFCTDNAAMIGASALMNYKPADWKTIKSNPELYFA